jgi:hypothetical protein
MGFLLMIVGLTLCVHREDALLVPLRKWVSSTSSSLQKQMPKFVSIGTALICINGLPAYSLASETPLSLTKQLSKLQEVKVANQKRRIEV